MKRDDKGITLVALIITIIVLLILAGITILSLSGENGILTRAKEAIGRSGKTSAKERVGIEVLGSYNMDEEIELDLLEENLKKIEGIEIEEPITSLPTTVVLDGNNIIINEDGTVEVSEWKQNGFEITNGKTTVKVGDIVLNYNETTKSAEIKAT